MQSESPEALRQPASIGSWTQKDFEHAQISVSAFELQEAQPAAGRSYFDKIFSEKNEYKVPYPFNQLLQRLSDYTAQKINDADSSGLKVAIFPMGRSLQRNAALINPGSNFSTDLFFRYPRVIIAVDEEPKIENALLLNLKDKLYIGYNEKAQILEAISYNEEIGRFEYQIVENYGEGKVPKVLYANRSLCISCHQNQAPLFSRGPWSESNANPVIAENLQNVFERIFGKVNCSPGKNQIYCSEGNQGYYFGAPLHIESNVARKMDASTDLANLTQAYQKMWKDVCVTSECKVAILKSILLYRLTGQRRLLPSNETKEQLALFETAWQVQFPRGLSIPSADIPDRDPLKDVISKSKLSGSSMVSDLNKSLIQSLLAQSKIPNEFEPLLPRPPFDIWKDTGLDTTNTNRLIRGLAQEFTAVDLNLIDSWLRNHRKENEVVTQLTTPCEIQKEKNDMVIICQGRSEESFTFDAYIKMSGSRGDAQVAGLRLRSQVLGCEESSLKGDRCPIFSDLEGVYQKNSEREATLVLKLKNGLGLKTDQGYDVSEVIFDMDAKVAQIKVYNQAAFLQEALLKNQMALFSQPVFNRFQLMKTLLEKAQVKLNKVHTSIDSQLPLHLDSQATMENISQQMTGFGLMKNVCAQCHQSNVRTPPNFMGSISNPLSDLQQCRRIERCAPRILYRLKMRNCDDHVISQKKNAMPPDTFFRDRVAVEQWKQIHSPKIEKFISNLIDEQQLAHEMTSDGLDNEQAQRIAADLMSSTCPDFNSVFYDQLPKCESNNLRFMTRCK